MTRRILRVAIAAAMTGMMGIAAMASGCAARTEPSSPAAGAPTSVSDAAAPAPAASNAAASTLSDDDQVREAVFRYLFTHNASGSKDRAAVYFLALGDGDEKQRDPSAALMARFAGHQPPVEPVSRARVGQFEGARHRGTGKSGIVFRISAIKRVSDDVVDVECGYYEGNLSASGEIYRVERKAGVWVVTEAKMQWIA
jgi:hypothetical protein